MAGSAKPTGCLQSGAGLLKVSSQGGLVQAGQVQAKVGRLLPEGGLAQHLREERLIAEARYMDAPQALRSMQGSAAGRRAQPSHAQLRAGAAELPCRLTQPC